jgi:hypothetical protein
MPCGPQLSMYFFRSWSSHSKTRYRRFSLCSTSRSLGGGGGRGGGEREKVQCACEGERQDTGHTHVAGRRPGGGHAWCGA